MTYILLTSKEVHHNILFFCSGEINTKLSTTEEYPGKLVGSWNTVYGEGDEASEEFFCFVCKTKN